MRTSTKCWIGMAVALALLQALASATLTRGLALTAISDFITLFMLIAIVTAFAKNAIPARGRLRVFWVLQAIGWLITLSNQLLWTLYDVLLQKSVPTLFAGDVLLFLPGVLMLAGFLLRPHLEQSKRSARLGMLDFLLLILWWIYFYGYLVSCWQYISPNEDLYNRNYDRLYMMQIVVVVSVLSLLIKQSTGQWRRFYALYIGTVLFNYLWFVLVNRAIEHSTYFSGSWYDPACAAAFVLFVVIAVFGRGLRLTRESTELENRGSWMTTLAILAVLSLPVIVLAAVLERGVSLEVMHFRVLITAVAMFVMAALVFMKQHLLHRELKQANQVLEESSTTDPLTGIRNRRFFAATIQRDIGQCVRAYAEACDTPERDLIFYLIDLDNFKKVNDLHGHDAGDRVLIEASRRISSAIRNSDLLVRWGGEEFLVVSRATDRRRAAILADRVLSAFRDKPFSVGSTDQLQLTCSIGWAAFPWLEEDIEAVGFEVVLKYADRGLYRAKKAGKDQAIGMTPSRELAEPGRGHEDFDYSLSRSELLPAGHTIENLK
jgi:diguanylate cyclase (GGDEF)-like protein